MKTCLKHPKYRGTGEPKNKNPCTICMEIYLFMLKPRLPIKQTQVEKTKKVYNRQKEKKIKEDQFETTRKVP